VSRAENFVNAPQKSTVLRLARALDVEVSELYAEHPKIPSAAKVRQLRRARRAPYQKGAPHG
jgi:hypothetical protein